MRTIAEVEADFDQCADWEAVGNMVYSRATKPEFDRTIAEISTRYKDFRGGAVKDALKSQLAGAILNVVSRSRDYLTSEMADILERDIEIAARAVWLEQRKEQERLVERVYKHKAEYIESFPDAAEGARAWLCLIDLIEEGNVIEAQLPEYGINLNV